MDAINIIFCFPVAAEPAQERMLFGKMKGKTCAIIKKRGK
jgi:hypothetical protein